MIWLQDFKPGSDCTWTNAQFEEFINTNSVEQMRVIKGTNNGTGQEISFTVSVSNSSSLANKPPSNLLISKGGLPVSKNILLLHNQFTFLGLNMVPFNSRINALNILGQGGIRLEGKFFIIMKEL